MAATANYNLVLTENGELVCGHADAYIQKACCSQPGDSGYIECGCQGMDGVVCPATNCTGIEDHEVDDLFERLQNG